MMHTPRTLTALVLTAATAIWLAPIPAAAQRAVPRGGDSHSQGGGDGRRGPSGSGRAAPSAPSGGSTTRSAGRSEPRDGGTRRQGQDSRRDSGRRAGDRPALSRAVPRRGPVPPPRSDRPVRVYGYPWGYGGIGYYGGYWGGYYDPYWYDPWWYGPSYPRYYPQYRDGELRLQVKPREAAVFVDGYYAGIVDDFDGFFQRLTVDAGGHHLEFRLAGYETLSVDLHVQRGRTITYHGELQPIQ